MLRQTLLALVLISAACAADHESSVGPAVTAPKPSPSAGVATLAHDVNCQSKATPVNITGERMPLTDIVNMLSLVGEVKITVERDIKGFVVSGSVSDEPWDCVLRSLTSQVGLRIEFTADGMRLVPAERGDKP